MLLGFYAGNDQNFLVELKPETARKCAGAFRKIQSFCGKDSFSLEVEEFVMRDFPLDGVWELDLDVEFPEESDFVEVPPKTVEKKSSEFFSSNLVLGEMGAYWYLNHQYFPSIQTPVLTRDQLDAIAILGQPYDFKGRI